MFKFQPFFVSIFVSQSEVLKVISYFQKKVCISTKRGKNYLEVVENIINTHKCCSGAYLQKSKSSQKSLINGLINLRNYNFFLQ